MLDFVFRRFPFYLLYVISYGFTIVTLFIYGRVMGDHVFFLLFWLSVVGFMWGAFLFLFYEASTTTSIVDQNEEIEPKTGTYIFKTVSFSSDLYNMFISQKRSVFTPFFVLGFASAMNYILVAIANPHVKSIYQVLASILQLPFVIIFNYIINHEKIFESSSPWIPQIICWISVFFFYIFGLVLISINEFESKFENVGWFLVYITSTLPVPFISVIFQSIFGKVAKFKYVQSDFYTYSKPSLTFMMINFWQLVILTATIWLIPMIDKTNINYSFSTGFDCVFQGVSIDQTDKCQKAFLVLNFLSFSAIFNVYASIKVITFEDANFAILVQQLGPIVAAFVFSSPEFMGSFYDGQQNSYKSYVSIASILIAFTVYKFNKTKYITKTTKTGEKPSLFEKLWILPIPGSNLRGGDSEEESLIQ